jgi:hypothetical protein
MGGIGSDESETVVFFDGVWQTCIRIQGLFGGALFKVILFEK